MTRDKLLRSILVLYGVALIVTAGSILPWSRWVHGGAGLQNGSIAEVHINGVIQMNMKTTAWSGPDAEDIAQQLHRLSKNDDVKAILLQINSPGGTVGAVQAVQAEILRCKANKKIVIATLGDVAASGGYYLASASDRIVSEPGTIVGSIGVIMQFGDLQGLMQKLGVRWEVIKSGAHKDIGSPARSLTPEERQLLQASIDDAYDQFLEAVVQGRHMPADRVRPLADGRIFTGRQALAQGLVDELEMREDAIQAAIRLAHLPPHPPIISDDSHSLSALIRQMSAQGPGSTLESISGATQGPSLEYLWR